MYQNSKATIKISLAKENINQPQPPGWGLRAFFSVINKQRLKT